MNIQYLNSDLRELNIKLRAAFEKAQGLSEEDVTQCRWVAMGMRPATTEVSASQRAVVDELKAIVDFARGKSLVCFEWHVGDLPWPDPES